MYSDEAKKELLALFTELIAIPSENPPGNEKQAAEFIRDIFQKDGIKTEIIEKEPGRSNVYAEIGDGEKPPILLLSHIDVVPGTGEWKFPPFSAYNHNGIIYGRGTLDTKHLTAMEIMAILLLKRSGITLNRKIKFLATADEENGSAYGMEFIAKEYPELMAAEYVISEGGGFVITQNNKKFRTITCGEKGACAMSLFWEKDDNVSVFSASETKAGKLLQCLKALSAYEPEEEITPPTRLFLEATEGVIEDKTLKDLWQYSTKSCLTINGFEYIASKEEEEEKGSLPLTYNFIHGTTEQDIKEIMEHLLSETKGECTINGISEGYENSMENPFIEALEDISNQYDPGTKLLPMIALGRTDGRFIRKNVYGYSPMLDDIPFSEVLKKVHQIDECISEKSLYYGAEVLYDTLCRLV